MVMLRAESNSHAYWSHLEACDTRYLPSHWLRFYPRPKVRVVYGARVEQGLAGLVLMGVRPPNVEAYSPTNDDEEELKNTGIKAVH